MKGRGDNLRNTIGIAESYTDSKLLFNCVRMQVVFNLALSS
jgi:hypothetical protein